LIRARRFTDEGITAIAADLEACGKLRRLPDAVLIDAATPGKYGGTGTTVSWSGLVDYHRWLHNVPLILAGGLTPENVSEAIHMVRPHGVDVASGVESSPGRKDCVKIREFVAAAREAFQRLE
jgi:phosphoribosylanthranilate isomerase